MTADGKVGVEQVWESKLDTCHGGVVHVGRRPGEFTTRFELPAYTVARAFASYDASQSLTLRLDVDNLFNRTYYTTSFSALWVQPGAPRSARVSASFRL